MEAEVGKDSFLIVCDFEEGNVRVGKGRVRTEEDIERRGFCGKGTFSHCF